MKKFSRLLAMLLAVAMILAMAACGNSAASASADEAEAASAAEAVSAEETAEAEEAPAAEAEEAPAAEAEEASAAEAEEAPAEEPAAEETAATYTGATPAAESAVTYPLEDAVTLTFWSPFNSTMPGVYDTITDIPAVAAISEATGVEIEWTVVSGAEMFSSFNLMAAAGDYCDLITAAVECYSGGAVSALDDGVIVDLTDYVEEYAPDYLAAFTSRNAEKDITTDDGRYACLYGAYNELFNNQGYVIRQDWLDELGLDTPVTYDDYYEVLTAFKDAYGCTEAFMMDETCQDEYHTSGGFGTSGYKNGHFGTGSDLYQIDGEVVSSFNQDSYRQYLAEMNKWYEAGLFSADFVTLTSSPNGDDRTQLISEGKSGIWYVGATSIDVQVEAIGGDAEVVGITDPVTEEGEINHFSSATIINTQCDVSVSSDCENIEAAVAYLNYYFTDEGIRLYNYGVEGETYNLEDGEIAYTDVILGATDYTPYTMTEAYVLVGYVCSVTDANRSRAFNSDATKDALDLWNASQDNANVIPKGVALTSEESSDVSAIQSDLYTYVAECIPKFILGEMDIDSQWDEFVSTCESMGLNDEIEIYQGAYDRYMA